mmetsp:Transcript_62139/g.110755  ORF Transcript_62139/g.110755 Transcript_62139/m.110755 type:complete len:321 (-) Transcript_62139:1014-1976(-)
MLRDTDRPNVRQVRNVEVHGDGLVVHGRGLLALAAATRQEAAEVGEGPDVLHRGGRLQHVEGQHDPNRLQLLDVRANDLRGLIGGLQVQGTAAMEQAEGRLLLLVDDGDVGGRVPLVLRVGGHKVPLEVDHAVAALLLLLLDDDLQPQVPAEDQDGLVHNVSDRSKHGDGEITVPQEASGMDGAAALDAVDGDRGHGGVLLAGHLDCCWVCLCRLITGSGRWGWGRRPGGLGSSRRSCRLAGLTSGGRCYGCGWHGNFPLHLLIQILDFGGGRGRVLCFQLQDHVVLKVIADLLESCEEGVCAMAVLRGVQLLAILPHLN